MAGLRYEKIMFVVVFILAALGWFYRWQVIFMNYINYEYVGLFECLAEALSLMNYSTRVWVNISSSMEVFR